MKNVLKTLAVSLAILGICVIFPLSIVESADSYRLNVNALTLPLVASPGNPSGATLVNVYADTTAQKIACLTSTGADCMPRSTGTIQLSLYESAGIATGVKLFSCAHVESSGTINRATLLVAPSGNFTAEILRTTYTAWDAGATHPVTGDKISASAPVTVTGGTKSQDATLTGWTTTVAAGDVICANVTAAATVTTAHISLRTVRGLD